MSSIAVSANDAAGSARRLERTHVALLIGVIALAHGGTFTAPFVFDDFHWIVENEAIRELWPPSKAFAGPRPVLNLSLALNYALHGLNVVGFHAVNLLIHTGCALLLYAIVRRLLARSGGSARSARRGAWMACVAAGLWAVHPLQTQAVTYVVQRCESLATFFYLLCVYGVVRGAESRGSRSARWWCVLAVVAMGLGVGTKEIVVTAPIVAVLLDRAFFSEGLRECMRKRWGLYLGLFLSWGWLVGRAVTGLFDSTTSAGFQYKGFTALEYAATQPLVILHYLKLALWPSQQCFDYYWPVARSFSAIVVPAGLLAVLVSLAAVLWIRRPRVGVVALAFFLILAPSSSVLPIADLAVEHRMYLPLASVVVLAVLAAEWLLRVLAARWAAGVAMRVQVAVPLTAVLVLIVLTFQRNLLYADLSKLWADVLVSSPRNPRAYHELGVLRLQKDKAEALSLFRSAVRHSDGSTLRPFSRYHYSLANALHEAGSLNEAIHHYRRALQLQPRSARVHINLGAAYSELERWDDAVASFRRSLALKPGSSLAHNNLAIVLVKAGRPEEALEHFEAATRRGQPLPLTRYRWAQALSGLGREVEAIEVLRSVVKIEPRFLSAYRELARLLIATGRINAALDALRELLRRNPADRMARSELRFLGLVKRLLSSED